MVALDSMMSRGKQNRKKKKLDIEEFRQAVKSNNPGRIRNILGRLKKLDAAGNGLAQYVLIIWYAKGPFDIEAFDRNYTFDDPIFLMLNNKQYMDGSFFKDVREDMEEAEKIVDDFVLKEFPLGKGDIIGQSTAMQELFDQIRKASRNDSNVLITGKSGVGKELVAKAIHANSSRCNETLEPVNCAAIPDTLLESELFGYERGAFTGAERRHIGKLEKCNGGTLFLDEIGDLSLRSQAKVLRVLQEGVLEKLGSTETIEVDIRIIAATNKNIEEEVKAKRFREDLYYRLKVIEIEIPPLHERKKDIPPLVNHFASKLEKDVTRNLLIALFLHDWPGNVRELEHVMESMEANSEEDILSLEDLPGELKIAVDEAGLHEGKDIVGMGFVTEDKKNKKVNLIKKLIRKMDSPTFKPNKDFTKLYKFAKLLEKYNGVRIAISAAKEIIEFEYVHEDKTRKFKMEFKRKQHVNHLVKELKEWAVKNYGEEFKSI
jgi:DNA-binding NtrC family response regulator